MNSDNKNKEELPGALTPTAQTDSSNSPSLPQDELNTVRTYPADEVAIKGPDLFQKKPLPWIKIALMGIGFVFALLAAALFVLFNAAFILGILYFAIFLFPLLAIALLIIGFKISTDQFSKFGVRYPATSSIIALSLLISLSALYTKFIPASFYILLTGRDYTTAEKILLNPLTTLIAILFIGSISFVGAVFLTNKIKLGRYSLLLVPLICVPALYFSLTIQRPASVQFQKLTELEWALLPSYLPAGLKDGVSEKCADQTVYSADRSYNCSYYFKTYPGYLSQETQAEFAKFAEAENKTDLTRYAPLPFFDVRVTKDDQVLNPYKIKNEQCDYNELRSLAAASLVYRDKLIRENPPDTKRCLTDTTPGGQTVVYHSFLNDKEVVEVPTQYYFEKDGNLIFITVDTNSHIPKTRVKALYLTDKNYKTELYKFIDSFHPAAQGRE